MRKGVVLFLAALVLGVFGALWQVGCSSIGSQSGAPPPVDKLQDIPKITIKPKPNVNGGEVGTQWLAEYPAAAGDAAKKAPVDLSQGFTPAMWNFMRSRMPVVDGVDAAGNAVTALDTIVFGAKSVKVTYGRCARGFCWYANGYVVEACPNGVGLDERVCALPSFFFAEWQGSSAKSSYTLDYR